MESIAESIVNNPGSPDSALSYRVSSREDRNREAALHHAKLLHERKDTELQILESTELLIDYPTSPGSDAQHPSTKDTESLKRMLIPFQVPDYDALVEERNINRKCGYTLCPEPNKLQGTTAKFGFLYSKSEGTKIVDRKLLERWCSPECGKRALYLRVQLAEEPAWERVGGVGGNFVLFDERFHLSASTDRVSKITDQIGKIDMRNDEEKMVAAMKELAIERGDGNARLNSKTLANVQISEKIQGGEQQSQVQAKINQQSAEIHSQIEGYEPRILSGFD